MRSAYRITPKIVVALVIAGVSLIGWVARSTRAQVGAEPSLPIAPPDAPKVAPGSTPLDLPAPSAPRSPFDLDPAGPNSAGPGNDDPEKSARAFLEQNRKVAQGELKSLKDEADRLRTRLGKVEAGIRRWEALLAALENSEKSPAPGTVPPGWPDHPTYLSPIGEPKKAGVARQSERIPPAARSETPPPLGPPEAPREATKPAELPKHPASDGTPPVSAGAEVVPIPPVSPGSEPAPR